MAKPQYQGPWRIIRLAVLNRDGWQCQIRGPRCQGRASTVDHIDRVADYGPNWNPDRMRAACKPCNSADGAAVTNARRWSDKPLAW